MAYEKKHCWSVLLRLYHWAFALSIITLCITGFYIHGPWTNTLREGSASFPMAYMRFIHFVAGYVFTAAVLTRIFLERWGNKQERRLERPTLCSSIPANHRIMARSWEEPDRRTTGTSATESVTRSGSRSGWPVG